MTTHLYLRVILVLVAYHLDAVPGVLAQPLVSGVEEVEVHGDSAGAAHGILRLPDAPVKTGMLLLKLALEFLQAEIVNLLMSCLS